MPRTRDQRGQGIFVTDPRELGHFLIGFKSHGVRKFEEKRPLDSHQSCREARRCFITVSSRTCRNDARRFPILSSFPLPDHSIPLFSRSTSLL